MFKLIVLWIRQKLGLKIDKDKSVEKSKVNKFLKYTIFSILALFSIAFGFLIGNALEKSTITIKHPKASETVKPVPTMTPVPTIAPIPEPTPITKKSYSSIYVDLESKDVKFLRDNQPINIKFDNIYFSLDKGGYVEEVSFNGQTTVNVYLTEQAYKPGKNYITVGGGWIEWKKVDN